MSLHVVRCADAAEYLARAEDFLLAHEAENCLPLALANQLRLYPARVEQPPYLALVEDGGSVLAAALMTPPLRLVLARTGSREALTALVADVHALRPNLPGVGGPTPSAEWFAAGWQALTGQAHTASMAERLYRLDRVIPPAGIAGRARRAGGSDRDLLIEWLSAFELEAFGTLSSNVLARVDDILEMSTRGMYFWEDGAPVAMAGFGGFTPHSARIGPVYTPRRLRGHGYASAVTAWLSQHLLDQGRAFCTLFTDLSNHTANHIYQTLGYAPVCDVTDIKFTPVAV